MLLALVMLPFLLLGDDFGMSALERHGAPLTVGAIGALLLALDTLLPVPSSAVATAMGYSLGGWGGTLANSVGLTAGCLLGLAVGGAGSPLARRLLGEPLYAAFQAWLERYGIAALLLCRAVPVLAEASIIAMGAGRARPLRVLAAAAAADTVLGAAYAFAGAAARHAASPAIPAAAAAFGIPAAAGLISFAWVKLRAKSS